MSLKKFLKSYYKVRDGEGHKPSLCLFRCSGQAAVEYFILLTVIAAFCIAGTMFFSKIRNETEQFTNKAVHKMAPNLAWSP